jgi:H+/Cl- antiporter ClcA
LAFLEIVQSLILPIVIYMIFINAAFIGISLGSNLTLAPVLLAPPYSWSFNNLGLIVVTAFIASIFIMLGGWCSDWNVNRITRKNNGRREAEYNLYNFIFPLFIGFLGCILYGVGGQYVNDVHWMAIMTGTTMLLYAFLTCNIVASVVSIESYPQLAG